MADVTTATGAASGAEESASPITITDVPYVVLQKIAKNLTNVQDVANFTRTCHDTATACNQAPVWQHLLKQHAWRHPLTHTTNQIHRNPQHLFRTRFRAEANLCNNSPVRTWTSNKPVHGNTVDTVCINRQHNMVMSSYCDEVAIWDLQANVHKVGRTKSSCKGCLQTACDLFAVFGRPGLLAVFDFVTGQAYCMVNMLPWLKEHDGDSGAHDDDDYYDRDRDAEPYPPHNIQILNHHLLLTSHQAGDVTLLDLRTKPSSHPAIHYRLHMHGGPGHAKCFGAYATHNYCRGRVIPSVLDIEHIAVGCMGHYTPGYVYPELRLLDIRMPAAQGGGVLQGGGVVPCNEVVSSRVLPGEVDMMDVAGRRVAMCGYDAGRDMYRHEEWESPCVVQVFDTGVPHSMQDPVQGPAVFDSPNGYRYGLGPRLTDDGRCVLLPNADWSMHVWRVDGLGASPTVLEYQTPLVLEQDRLRHWPPPCVDVADTLVVAGRGRGLWVAEFADFGEG